MIIAYLAESIDWSPWIKSVPIVMLIMNAIARRLMTTCSGNQMMEWLLHSPSYDGYRRNYSCGRTRCVAEPAGTSNGVVGLAQAIDEANLSTARLTRFSATFSWCNQPALIRSHRSRSVHRLPRRNLWTRRRSLLVSARLIEVVKAR